MSTTADRLDAQLKELNEYRRRVGPPLPKLEEIKQGQVVSAQELNALREAQGMGKYDKFRGLREVVYHDTGGRPIRHWFGSERAAWTPFEGPELKIGRINRSAS